MRRMSEEERRRMQVWRDLINTPSAQMFEDIPKGEPNVWTIPDVDYSTPGSTDLGPAEWWSGLGSEDEV